MEHFMECCMECCTKCGKILASKRIINAYGESRCPDCYDDYLMTDRGKVEYFIGICNKDYSIDIFDADFLGHLSVCWRKYRDQLNMNIIEIKRIEAIAEYLGIL